MLFKEAATSLCQCFARRDSSASAAKNKGKIKSKGKGKGKRDPNPNSIQHQQTPSTTSTATATSTATTTKTLLLAAAATTTAKCDNNDASSCLIAAGTGTSTDTGTVDSLVDYSANIVPLDSSSSGGNSDNNNNNNSNNDISSSTTTTTTTANNKNNDNDNDNNSIPNATKKKESNISSNSTISLRSKTKTKKESYSSSSSSSSSSSRRNQKRQRNNNNGNETNNKTNGVAAIEMTRKSKAVANAVAMKARRELENERRKAYTKVLGPLRMGFVSYDDCDGYGYEDGDGDDIIDFNEEYLEFLNDEQKEQEKKKQEQDNQWYHTFKSYNYNNGDSNNNNNNNIQKKTKKKNSSSSTTTTPSPSPPSDAAAAAVAAHMINIRKLHREYIAYASNLPATPEGSIFVRVPEDRLDLPRILITGPHDTPYSNGLFFFDCYMKDYPHAAPNVKFLTTGHGSVRFNPNLYNCGKVCLSLLGTWQGPGWISGSSTLLQVLVSCQGLILGTDEPFYNEPGFESYKGKPQYEQESNRYNKEIRKQTLKWAILDPLKKIVVQEERVEKRRLYLQQLKEQRQRKKQEQEQLRIKKEQEQKRRQQEEEEEKKQHKLEEEKDDDDDDNGNNSAIVAATVTSPTTTNSKKKNSSSSSDNNKKKRWSNITVPLWPILSLSLSSSSPSSEVLLSPSNMPSRKSYEHAEFTSIAIKHFIQTADHIEEQLQSWAKLDPRGTKYHAEEIRKWLKRLIDLVEERNARSASSKAASRAAS